jgi:pyruvate/2-oxoglutarate dehydrogenase complex dihydrolipoamide acyltransferase (E2) component
MPPLDPATPPEAQSSVTAPFAGVVVSIARQPGERIGSGAPLIVLEAMKMEHEVLAQAGGVLCSVEVAIGDAVEEGQVLALIGAHSGDDRSAPQASLAGAEDGFRADLEAVRERHAVGLDEARPEAVARRRERGRRTARENLAELLDEGSYVEYGPLLFAAQEARR